MSAGESESPPKGGSISSITVTPADLKAITPEVLEALKREHGLELVIRSSAAGVDELLSQTVGGELRVEYDRDIDRPTPVVVGKPRIAKG